MFPKTTVTVQYIRPARTVTKAITETCLHKAAISDGITDIVIQLNNVEYNAISDGRDEVTK